MNIRPTQTCICVCTLASANIMHNGYIFKTKVHCVYIEAKTLVTSIWERIEERAIKIG